MSPPPTVRHVFEPLAEQQGWDHETRLEFALAFIDHQGEGEKFLAYLRKILRTEEDS